MREKINLIIGISLATLCFATPSTAERLAFRIDEGHNINSFVREGPVAAHLLLRSGSEPRVLVAFPAGNSGVGLWFESAARPVSWTLLAPPKPLTVLDDERRPLHGIEFEVELSARELRPRAAILSSVRLLRDYELLRDAPAAVIVAPRLARGGLTWSRDRLDGAPGYLLSVHAIDGARITPTSFTATTSRPLRLRIVALTGDAPLVPLEHALASRAAGDARSRDVLAFLGYREKFLAGSWRFNTYFGRDTLISALLLAPVLEPEAVESALSSVLDRLAPNGEVAHEEDIGEFAVMRNLREGRGKSATPIYDYGMVDDDFLLAPLAVRWLLDDARGRERARKFLTTSGAGGVRRGKALARNFAWVVSRTAAFAGDPRASQLVGNKSGRTTGQWRDSDRGLGGGRYAYDVNAALVPAALEAVARIAESSVLGDDLDVTQRQLLAHARSQARTWSERAPALFDVDVSGTRARAQIAAYAKEVGIDVGNLGSEVSFHALALDDEGRPIPILHSDEGFRLLLTDPSPGEITKRILPVLRPFPVGLMTDAGMLVANPALASAALKRDFTRYAYHGTVVWSWQQALFAAGIERQLRRDLPDDVRRQLRGARTALWSAIESSRAMRTSELWSWSYSAGAFHVEAFGRPGADVDESNAAQLWSTVYLGLTPPAIDPPR
jgi:glycogen debranching enzyme